MMSSMQYYIPGTIVVGQFNEYAFVTCKFKNEKWIGPGIFERLCGYKPYSQRDSCKQLKKLISNAVFELSNDPVEGFEFAAPNDDPYKMHVAYGARGDIILKDPRGFKVAMPEENFWKMLETCNYNIKDRTIVGKFAYVWATGTNRFMLLEEKSSEYKQWKEHSQNIKKQNDSMRYVSCKDLVIGKTYKTKHGESWMYLGKHDTYSAECHLEALDNPESRYSEIMLSKFRNDKLDLTTAEKHIFYNVGVRLSDGIYLSNALIKNAMPYLARSSVSKLLVSEVNDIDVAKFRMHNSDLPCTYANVKSDMASSLFFHKIDFSRSGTSLEPLDIDVFRFEYGNGKCQFFQNFYPFSRYYAAYYIDTYEYGKVHICRYGNCYELKGYATVPFKYLPSYSNLATFDNCTIESLYESIKPCVRQFYLDNGNKVSQFVARCLLSKAYRHRY